MRMRYLLPLLAVNLGLLAGCGHAGRYGEEMRIARESYVPGDNTATERADAEALYNTARGFLVSGDARRANGLYEKLLARFPFSQYATQAQLESIYSNYLLQQWETALADADQFIKQHPRHPEIAYVYYMRGLINFTRTAGGNVLLDLPKEQRDTSHLRQAFTDFNLLIRRFPDSVYNKDAQLHMIEIRHKLAAHELAVAEYYVDRRAWIAAIRRSEYILDHFQGADSVPRALEIMEQGYRELGLENLAQNAHAVLVASYPNYLPNRTEFYRQRAGLEPRYQLPPMGGVPGHTEQAAKPPRKQVSQR